MKLTRRSNSPRSSTTTPRCGNPISGLAVAFAVFGVSVAFCNGALAAPATGPLADRNLTLVELDALNLADPKQGAHFAGGRATSVLDAAFSAYFYSGGGNYRYVPIRPAIPLIEAGGGAQSATEQTSGGGLTTGSAGTYPKDSGGIVTVSAGYPGETHATASLATGILRNSARFDLEGPSVSRTPAHPYDGFGAQGSSTSRAEIADYVTVSKPATLTLAGVWDGTLNANVPGSFVVTELNTPAVLAKGPGLAQVTVHMEIAIWSAPRVLHHPGDGETPGYDTYQRSYIGGISLDRSVTAGQSLTVHEPFSTTISVPAGELYFYASQSVVAGGGSDPSQGMGGSVWAQVHTEANFDHTLQFNLTPDAASGATLSSQSGEFLTQVANAVTPSLGVTRTAGQILLTWPDSANGFVLQTTSSASINATWNPVTNGITQANGQSQFTIPGSASAGFYRLSKP